jgi:hypothetical protein
VCGADAHTRGQWPCRSRRPRRSRRRSRRPAAAS